MTEKTKGGAYTTEISLHPPAAHKTTNSDNVNFNESHSLVCYDNNQGVSYDIPVCCGHWDYLG